MQSNNIKFLVVLIATLLLSGASCSTLIYKGQSIGCPPDCGENFSIAGISTNLPIEEFIKTCKCPDCEGGVEKACIVVAAAPGSETAGNAITFD